MSFDNFIRRIGPNAKISLEFHGTANFYIFFDSLIYKLKTTGVIMPKIELKGVLEESEDDGLILDYDFTCLPFR